MRNTEFCGAYPCVYWEKEEINARKSRGVMRFGAWATAGKKGAGEWEKGNWGVMDYRILKGDGAIN